MQLSARTRQAIINSLTAGQQTRLLAQLLPPVPCSGYCDLGQHRLN